MKRRNLDKTWDFMPENAFDNKSPEEAYIDMYEYAKHLEDVVKQKQAEIEKYKNETRTLNRATFRKFVRIKKVKNTFKEMFKL